MQLGYCSRMISWYRQRQQYRRGDWNCRTGHCRTGLAGVDNDGRPTDWSNLACYRCCGSV